LKHASTAIQQRRTIVIAALLKDPQIVFPHLRFYGDLWSVPESSVSRPKPLPEPTVTLGEWLYLASRIYSDAEMWAACFFLVDSCRIC
jgi:hypothetical protein